MRRTMAKTDHLEIYYGSRSEMWVEPRCGMMASALCALTHCALRFLYTSHILWYSMVTDAWPWDPVPSSGGDARSGNYLKWTLYSIALSIMVHVQKMDTHIAITVSLYIAMKIIMVKGHTKFTLPSFSSAQMHSTHLRIWPHTHTHTHTLTVC